jgi:hypothetical protein
MEQRRVIRMLRGSIALAIVMSAVASGSPAAALAWRAQSVPAPVVQYGAFAAVACSSSAACTAVGTFPLAPGGLPSLQSDDGIPQEAFVARWDGRRWKSQTVPVPIRAKSSALVAVACRVRTLCVAVGWYAVSRARSYPLVERWNGRKWEAGASGDSHGGLVRLAACMRDRRFGPDCPWATAGAHRALESAPMDGPEHSRAAAQCQQPA